MKRKKILDRLAGGCLVAAVCVACSPGAGLEGEWVQPVPGMVGSEQGFSLQAGGKAESIGMATLQYESWAREGDRLILKGKSIGNHQTLDFSDTLSVEKLTADSLVLKRGALSMSYGRRR